MGIWHLLFAHFSRNNDHMTSLTRQITVSGLAFSVSDTEELVPSYYPFTFLSAMQGTIIPLIVGVGSITIRFRISSNVVKYARRSIRRSSSSSSHSRRPTVTQISPTTKTRLQIPPGLFEPT